jgi:hypothetical protein
VRRLAAAVAIAVALLAGCCHPGPAACSRPSLPSGDAARIHGHEAVCTGGRWVKVSHYGG